MPTRRPTCPTTAGAEAKARELFASLGLDPAQFEFEPYADEWGAWVTAWLLCSTGQRAPRHDVCSAYGPPRVAPHRRRRVPRPTDPGRDQYDLVGIDHAIERLNDQQYG